MKTFKDALWLTRFELKHTTIQSIVHFVALFCFIIFFIRSIIRLTDFQINIGLDSMFISALIIIPMIARAKVFRIQKIAGSFSASPNLLHLLTLPIYKKTIALYRLFIQLTISSLCVSLLFLSMYDLLRDEVAALSYISCALFWISFSTLIGSLMSHGEAGYDIYDSILRFIGYGLLIPVLYFLAIYLWLPSGMVHWSFQLAYDNTLFLNAISMTLLMLNLFSIYRFTKKMKQTDYITSR